MGKNTTSRAMLLVCAVVACLVGLSSCGSPNAADVPDTVTVATVELSDVPMEVMQAEEVLMAQCARTKGFEVPVSYTVPAVPQSYSDVGGVFRSREEAQSVGYASQTVTNMEDTNAEQNEYVDSLSAADRERYDREIVSEEGNSCMVQAATMLYGSYRESTAIFNTFNEVQRERSASALDDKDVQSAIMDEYVPCMKRAGYEVRGLRGGELAGKTFGRYRAWNEAPNADERAMATQDWTCQVEAKLMERINDSLERSAGTWMLANEATILERHEKLQQAKGIANQVLAGKSSFEDMASADGKQD